MPLKSMELTPDEKRDAKLENAPEAWVPRYAGGTCLYLDDEVLKRLELRERPKVGTVFRLEAEARVTGSSEDEHERTDGTHIDKRVSLQITAMDLAPSSDKKGLADQLYRDEGKK